MCGYFISIFGWESIFHISGGMGLLWIICWIFFVYDTPAKHPTISSKEKSHIEKYVNNTIQARSKRVRKKHE